MWINISPPTCTPAHDSNTDLSITTRPDFYTSLYFLIDLLPDLTTCALLLARHSQLWWNNRLSNAQQTIAIWVWERIQHGCSHNNNTHFQHLHPECHWRLCFTLLSNTEPRRQKRERQDGLGFFFFSQWQKLALFSFSGHHTHTHTHSSVLASPPLSTRSFSITIL